MLLLFPYHRFSNYFKHHKKIYHFQNHNKFHQNSTFLWYSSKKHSNLVSNNKFPHSVVVTRKNVKSDIFFFQIISTPKYIIHILCLFQNYFLKSIPYLDILKTTSAAVLCSLQIFFSSSLFYYDCFLDICMSHKIWAEIWYVMLHTYVYLMFLSFH